jgi:hypothetical protein
MDEKPGKPSWRPQFTLLGLLAFAAACALATQAYLAWQAHVAGQDLRLAQMVLEDGAELSEESIVLIYYRNSERQCEAECRIPLSDKTAARRAHLERIIDAQRRQEAFAEIVLGGDPSAELTALAAYRQRAEQMVGDSDK